MNLLTLIGCIIFCEPVGHIATDSTAGRGGSGKALVQSNIMVGVYGLEDIVGRYCMTGQATVFPFNYLVFNGMAKNVTKHGK